MLEKWLKKRGSRYAEYRRKIWQRSSFFPAGLWIAVLVVSLIGGQALWRHNQRPQNLDALAAESGNVSYMLENEKPQVNHAGDRILFCHSSENGVGVFVCDVATGLKKMLFEEKEIRFGFGPHGVLTPFPWSPDDRWFVYAHQGAGVNAERAQPEQTALTICSADTDEKVETLVAPFGRVVALVWLSADAFVYVSGTEARDIMLVQKQIAGSWIQSRLERPVTAKGKIDNRFCSLGILSSNTIAWLQANQLWMMDVQSNITTKMCEFPKDKFFTAFDYSMQTKQFLLSCIESNADSLWQMNVDEPGGLTKVASDIRTHDNSWNDAMWINGGKGYTYIRRPGMQTSGLMVKTDPAVEPVVLFKQNYIQYCTPTHDGQRLFVVGDLNNQPGSAIWEYNLATGSRRCVVSASDRTLEHLKHVPIRYTNMKMATRERLNVVVFPPPNLDRQSAKKYPLVIVSIRYVVEDPYLYQYPEAIANAGAYVAVIDHGWSPKSLGSWAYHMNNVREYLSQFSAVDKQRIFAVSISAQAGGLTTLLTNKPGVWRGVISLSPPFSAMPNVADVAPERHLLRVLITSEPAMGNVATLKKYQEDGCANGLPVNYIIHSEAPHAFIAKRSQRARIQSMLHFIFND